MPLPLSKSAVNQLGKRLAATPEPADSDVDLLEELVQCHSDTLTVATSRILDLSDSADFGPIAITHRAKTTQTIIEKLQRQPEMVLARMQDLAGIRLVGPLTLQTQDALALEVTRRFPADPREPKIVDRRAMPSYGYRAVHVIASVDDVNVEIQVRTERQHFWANLTERFGDQFGRGIRYGEGARISSPVIVTLTESLLVLSDRLYEIERSPTCVPGFADPTGIDAATDSALAEFTRRFLPHQKT